MIKEIKRIDGGTYLDLNVIDDFPNSTDFKFEFYHNVYSPYKEAFYKDKRIVFPIRENYFEGYPRSPLQREAIIRGFRVSNEYSDINKILTMKVEPLKWWKFAEKREIKGIIRKIVNDREIKIVFNDADSASGCFKIR